LLSIFQNPFSASTTIILNEKLWNSAYELKIFDVAGKIVKQFPVMNQRRIDLIDNDLKSGIYFFTLMSDEEIIEMKKIIIN
jgi:hypothetical protein